MAANVTPVGLWTEPTGSVYRHNGLKMPRPGEWSSRQQLLDDMTSMYEGNPRANFKDVGQAIRDMGQAAGPLGLYEAKHQTKQLRKFVNSQLGQQIGEIAGDPKTAARMALEMLYWAGVNRNESERYGGEPSLGEALEAAGVPQNGDAQANGMGTAMKEALEEAAQKIKQESNLGGQPGEGDSDEDGQGQGDGDSDEAADGKWDTPQQKGSGGGSNILRGLGRGAHIKPLIQRLMLKYERARTSHHERTESLMPEDDIDLRSAKIGEIPYLMDLITHDDDVFYQKYVKGDLSTLRHWKIHTEDLSKTYAICIDVSGSMMDKSGSYTAADYAIASAIALLENALAGGNKVKVMFFDYAVSQAHTGTPSEMVQLLLSTPFSGGGTNIDAALESLDTTEYDEAILITDGGDRVARSHPIQPPLYTIFVGGGSNQQLAKLSRSYEEVKRV